MSTRNYDEVYGRPFAKYSSDLFKKFIEPFQIRLSRNEISATELFSGKDVLDAGCGGGRGSALVMREQPRSLTSVDISAVNVASTGARIGSMFPAANFTCLQGDLQDIFLKNKSVDTIWFSGVLQHTESPSDVIRELGRVLRPGGKMFIYVYGAGGVYWRVIKAIRDGLSDVPVETLTSALQDLNVATDRIAEFLDDWKVDFLRCYQKDRFEQILVAGGFDVKYLPLGTDYDTSNLRFQGIDSELVGEGDLRFVVTKSREGDEMSGENRRYLDENTMRENAFPLLDQGLESDFERFLGELTQASISNPEAELLKLANLQLMLRDQFLREPSLDWVKELITRR